jgi:hypothetical protein
MPRNPHGSAVPPNFPDPDYLKALLSDLRGQWADWLAYLADPVAYLAALAASDLAAP